MPIMLPRKMAIEKIIQALLSVSAIRSKQLMKLAASMLTVHGPCRSEKMTSLLCALIHLILWDFRSINFSE